MFGPLLDRGLELAKPDHPTRGHRLALVVRPGGDPEHRLEVRVVALVVAEDQDVVVPLARHGGQQVLAVAVRRSRRAVRPPTEPPACRRASGTGGRSAVCCKGPRPARPRRTAGGPGPQSGHRTPAPRPPGRRPIRGRRRPRPPGARCGRGGGPELSARRTTPAAATAAGRRLSAGRRTSP